MMSAIDRNHWPCSIGIPGRNHRNPHVRWLIEEWAKSIGGNDCLQRTLNRSPVIPDGLIDRDIDRWRPLLSIADACGVGAEAREAAKSPTFAIAQTDIRLLIVTDIRRVFDGLNAHHDRIWSDPLVKGLHALHDSPWSSEFTGLDDKKNPHKITAGELGHILRKEWEIRSGPVRIGTKVLKGYYRRDFEQAWSDVGLPPSPVKQQQNGSAAARPESVAGPKADSLLGLQRYK
jgi:Protein of unknown function (DUF3631)